jgi:hypothetical protein
VVIGSDYESEERKFLASSNLVFNPKINKTMKNKLLLVLIYLILPFRLIYLFIKDGFNWKYPIIYISIAWQCQKSKMQIDFGVCKTYTIDELLKELNS